MKKTYRVAAGVEWVNGAKVPPNRVVQLTEAEALYEKGLGRLEETGGRRKRAAADDEAES